MLCSKSLGLRPGTGSEHFSWPKLGRLRRIVSTFQPISQAYRASEGAESKRGGDYNGISRSRGNGRGSGRSSSGRSGEGRGRGRDMHNGGGGFQTVYSGRGPGDKSGGRSRGEDSSFRSIPSNAQSSARVWDSNIQQPDESFASEKRTNGISIPDQNFNSRNTRGSSRDSSSQHISASYGREYPRDSQQHGEQPYRRYRDGGRSSGRDRGLGSGSGRGSRQQQLAAQQEQRMAGKPKAQFFASSSFAGVGASPEIVAALQAMGVSRPSHIQAAAYRGLLSDAAHLVVGDHSGSGKTLAYLAPLVQLLRDEEAAAGRPVTSRNCPRLLIVVPTEELCQQVASVVKAVTAGAPLRSMLLTGGRPSRTQRDLLDQGVDVVVATPQRAADMLGSGHLRLDDCRAVVLDEADLLLSDVAAFSEQVAPLRAAAPPQTRFVLVTATLPAELFDALQGSFPGIGAALGPGLHRSAPGVVEQVIDCSGGDDINEESGGRRKAAALLQVLRAQGAQRAVVFCNKIETCRKVENLLRRTAKRPPPSRTHQPHINEAAQTSAGGQHNWDADRFQYDDAEGGMYGATSSEAKLHVGDISDSGNGSSGGTGPMWTVMPYHSAISPQQREDNLLAFSQPPRQGEPPAVLVTTDRLSRGIDAPGVGHVVLFDFPRDPSEYVRRAGRTARGATGRGVVSLLVLGRQVRLAYDIVERNAKGAPIHKVPVALVSAGARVPSRAEVAAAAAAGKPALINDIDDDDDVDDGIP